MHLSWSLLVPPPSGVHALPTLPLATQVPPRLSLRCQKTNDWVDYYLGDVESCPPQERRSVLSAKSKVAFHYRAIHRTLIQRLGKPTPEMSDELWQTICDMVRRRQ